MKKSNGRSRIRTCALAHVRRFIGVIIAYHALQYADIIEKWLRVVVSVWL